MRDSEERAFALECLRLAASQYGAPGPDQIVHAAAQYLEFVTGDDAAGKLAAVREAIR